MANKVQVHSSTGARSSEFTIMVIFFLHALAGGGVFTRIPDIQSSLGLGEAALGLALMAPPIGGLLSFLFASFIVERFGTRLICLIAIPTLAFASFSFSASPILLIGVFGLLLYGVSFSLTNVSMNVEADRIEAATGRRIMNRCHGWWSIGFLTASLIGVAARALQVSTGLHLGGMFVLSALLALLFILRMKQSPARPHSGQEKRPFISLPSIATLRIVGFGIVGSIVQGGTHNWSVIYMRDTFKAADWIDAMTIPAFLITLTIGRMLGDAWINRYGTVRVAIVLISVALVGLLAVIFANSVQLALLGFALMGLGVSVTFPMMVTAAAQLGDRPSSANVAAVTMTTGVAMLAIPPIMGFAAETYGIRAAFIALLPSFILGFAMIRYIVPAKEVPDDLS